MMIQRIQFVNNKIYHISSRTVGDTIIFAAKDDCCQLQKLGRPTSQFKDDKPVEIWVKRQFRLNFKKRQIYVAKIGTSDVPIY